MKTNFPDEVGLGLPYLSSIYFPHNINGVAQNKQVKGRRIHQQKCFPKNSSITDLFPGILEAYVLEIILKVTGSRRNRK